MKDSISEALGMKPLIPYKPDETTSEVVVVENSTDEDFNEVKSNLRKLLAKTGPALDDLIDTATGSEGSDKLYTALAALMKTFVEANRELADTHVKSIQARGGQQPTTINNNLNITAADLLKLIKKED